MDTQHTFWTLLKKYDKIEIPIIQRDYAQGRDSRDVERIRNKFINDYLINSLINNKNIELDFVYGSVMEAKKVKDDQQIFIPLDGQQRLTTLFLLHWFIAVKENRMDDAFGLLAKFTYETRPSAHDFCGKLIRKHDWKDIKNIRNEVLDAEWFSDDWNSDPTISSMLLMLQTFADSEPLVNCSNRLFDILIAEERMLISFYFIPLEKFGLTENLYIRMNARGKMLTDFENFKSEFYKIISDYHDLLEAVKDKIEYAWVEHLWDYQEKDSFVIDKPFMNILRFVTEMLYFKDAAFRADKYHNDFLDLGILSFIYSKKENIKFLIFALDNINLIEQHKDCLLWGDEVSIQHLLKTILEGKRDVTQYLLLYSSLLYYYNNAETANFNDYIRVVRNLVYNTADKSVREWPRLIKSLSNLVADTDVYTILLQKNFNDNLEGFNVAQRREEIAKAELIRLFPNAKSIIFSAEDNLNLHGNINTLLMANFASTFQAMKIFEWTNVEMQTFSIKKFEAHLKSYETIAINDFSDVWGNLLTSNLYTHNTWWSRLDYAEDYKRHPSVILLALEYSKARNGTTLESFLTEKEKRFVQKLCIKYPDLSMVRNVKEQLYLYYIIHLRVMNGKHQTFFKNDCNFGWLKKQAGFSSIFTNGIENDPNFERVNPIFQTYSSQFRFNLGLREKSALDEEIVGSGRKRSPFESLLRWAEL
jgi:hypothetical protein